MSALGALPDPTIEKLAIDAIRVLSMDAVEKANSGHPGLPMGCAEIACVLFSRFLKFDPKAPSWPDRDRFVLSAGHGSMLLYTMLHLAGYDLSMDEIRRFRQLGSKTPGHPEHGETPGVETTTGPLGQGFATAVGMALAESILAARFNGPGRKVVDHHTYVLASDGDLMEGISHEAGSLAGHLRLGKLICLYDDNKVSLDGPTSFAFTEDVEKRFQAYGWHTQRCDGHDPRAVERAIEAARAEEERPSLILCRTVIGKGSPNLAGTSKVHGAPLGAEEAKRTREALGWSLPPFEVPDEVRRFFAEAARRGAAARERWEREVEEWARSDPALAAEWQRRQRRELPKGWRDKLPKFAPSDKPIATRVASGKTINALAETVPELIGGSADLASSNNTLVAGQPAYSAADRRGRNLWFGVREYAMAAILNGMSLHGGLRPYGATFLVFSDYLRPALRLSALMRQPVVYIFTHDSIFLGEDGPTHQPVEHVPSLRSVPNLRVLRPADAAETVSAWAIALERTDGPTAIVLTRQNLPILPGTGDESLTRRGGYVIERESSAPAEIVLLATGSEVALALEASKLLREKGVRVRVVNMPCWDLFEEQPKEYRDSVLPPGVPARLAIEASSGLGWERYVGGSGAIHALSGFGASAPLADLARRFGFTPEAIARKALAILGKS